MAEAPMSLRCSAIPEHPEPDAQRVDRKPAAVRTPYGSAITINPMTDPETLADEDLAMSISGRRPRRRGLCLGRLHRRQLPRRRLGRHSGAARPGALPAVVPQSPAPFRADHRCGSRPGGGISALDHRQPVRRDPHHAPAEHRATPSSAAEPSPRPSSQQTATATSPLPSRPPPTPWRPRSPPRRSRWCRRPRRRTRRPPSSPARPRARTST